MDKHKTLRFHTPMFLKGLNVTIRRGTKWDSCLGLAWAETDTGQYIGPATIRFTQVMKFSDIDHSIHNYNHDPHCRDYDGILRELKELYEFFDPNEIVTLVWFEMGVDCELE